MAPETVTGTDLPLGGHSVEGLAEMEMAGGMVSMPAPDRLIDCGLPAALSVMVMAPVLVAIEVGAKVTEMVQAPLAAIVAPVQVSALLAKSLAFGPPIVTVEMVRLAVPVLVTVSVSGALVVPTFCGPNVRLFEERLNEDAPPLGEIFATNASTLPPKLACGGLTVGKSVE